MSNSVLVQKSLHEISCVTETYQAASWDTSNQRNKPNDGETWWDDDLICIIPDPDVRHHMMDEEGKRERP